MYKEGKKMAPPPPTQTLTQLFFNYLDPRKFMFWMIFVVILLIGAAVYGYYTFYLPSALARNFNDLSNKNPIANGQGGGGDILIYFFSVDWCPHCKTAKPEWQTFSDNYDDAEINGYTIRCMSKDCTDDSDAAVQDMVQKYQIEGYPTIKMVKEGKTIDFDAKVTNGNLEKFVTNMVGPADSKVDRKQG
jgi:thiol-disulfide isomerase/thioredoxin